MAILKMICPQYIPSLVEKQGEMDDKFAYRRPLLLSWKKNPKHRLGFLKYKNLGHRLGDQNGIDDKI
jgi:hypothetical protein